MKLEDFMRARGLDDAGMAALIGKVSDHAVKKWRYSERIPRTAQMNRIVQATGGLVTAADFFESPPVKRGRAA
jgi:hypothetical protein